jgi:putative aldouronate transport system permease protein
VKSSNISPLLANPAGKQSFLKYLMSHKLIYLMLLPGIIYYLVFQYYPMYGVIMAFQDFKFSKGYFGSPFVGLKNFIYMFQLQDFYQVFYNSMYLSVLRLIFCFPLPIFLALLLNEIRNITAKRFLQTTIYLPYFISWVVIGGILVNFLSPSWGIVNNFIKQLGYEPIFFLGKSEYFAPVVVFSSIWKYTGWDTILYLAAITSISPELYEAAIIDGATRFKRILYITLPCISSTIAMLLILRVGSLMSNGFEQIFLLQNNNNKTVSEVFETYSYWIGLITGNYSFGATVGLFTSVIGFILLLIANKIAKKVGEEGIW